MSGDIISQLQQATTDEQKTWIITEITLKTLPAKLADAVRVAAIPHWFDAPVLAALLSIDATEAEKLYQDIKALSFSEPFGNLGYALHDLTRAGILSHLISTQSDFFQQLNQRAYEYFYQFEDAQNTVEAIYHFLATDKIGGMEKFKEQIQNYIQSTNFSAVNNLIRNARELVKLDHLGSAESAEIDWQNYLMGQTLIKLGKRETFSERGLKYAMQAFQIFNPTADISKYQQLELPHFFDKLDTVKKDFLTQKLNEAKQSGNILLQAKWLAELGDTDLNKEDYATALQRYNEILTLNKNDEEAIANRGATYLNMGDYPAALADLTRALELDPGNAWALTRRGTTYFQMDNYPAALADLTRALELIPDDVGLVAVRGALLAGRGVLYGLLGDYPAALADFTRALELNPDDAGTLANRGATYLNMGDYPAALADLSRALELDPDDARTLTVRGATYGQLGDYPAALADLTRALELAPANAEALINRGATYCRLGDYPAALADLSRALELDPNNAAALTVRGATYRQLGDYPAALADLTRALELDPNNAAALTVRGATYRQLGDYPSALADLNHAIELEPQQERAHYGRGLIFLIQNRSEQAQADFSLAIQQANPLYEKNPENWPHTFNLAVSHLAAGHLAEAESLYRKALAHSIPAGILRVVNNDLDDFLHFFPDHTQAKAMRDLLRQRLDEQALVEKGSSS